MSIIYQNLNIFNRTKNYLRRGNKRILEIYDERLQRNILIGDEKIAGILIENSIQGEKVKSLIIGIGLNINQLKFKDYKRKCTSLKKVKGIEFSRFDILEKLKKTIETNFSKLKNDFTAFDREYLENLYQFNVWKGYLIYNQRKNACIKGVSFLSVIFASSNCTTKFVKIAVLA